LHNAIYSYTTILFRSFLLFLPPEMQNTQQVGTSLISRSHYEIMEPAALPLCPAAWTGGRTQPTAAGRWAALPLATAAMDDSPPPRGSSANGGDGSPQSGGSDAEDADDSWGGGGSGGGGMGSTPQNEEQAIELARAEVARLLPDTACDA
jgi:uncharacterized membrane protein YgcG